LLNDRYESHWKVLVDGRPDTLLRCNFIMRGVYLPAGQHTVEFRFQPPFKLLYVGLFAIGASLLILIGVIISSPKLVEESVVTVPEPEIKAVPVPTAKPSAGAPRKRKK
jgi:thiosulfate reductase cytochrome b subunit